MDRVIVPNFSDHLNIHLDCILQQDSFNRYNNPFERKATLQRPFPAIPLQLLDRLIRPDTCWWVSRLLNVPIEYGDINHYGGVFVYDKGDYLKSHVDAGRHPVNKQTKVATAVLYLTPAQIIFWKGEPAFLDAPIITQLDEVINIPANSCLFFLNHDQAYHEVPIITNNYPRVCITVSYIAPEGFKDPRFINDRTRAYFARHMSHPDSPELAELRQLRASEEHHESVYRV